MPNLTDHSRTANRFYSAIALISLHTLRGSLLDRDEISIFHGIVNARIDRDHRHDQLAMTSNGKLMKWNGKLLINKKMIAVI